MAIPSPLYQPQERVFHSYAGSDIRAFALHPATQRFVELANIQTVSYSIFRDKVPVRSLGTTHAKQYTRGPRTVAGSIIFTVFNYGILGELIGNLPSEAEARVWRPVTVDQLPPFHILLIYASELFHMASMVIFNCELVVEGQVMSIEDLITENTCQYVATHISPLRPLMRGGPVGMAFTARNFYELVQEPLYRELYYARLPYDNQMVNSTGAELLYTLSGGKRLNE